jgi:L-threonylcarbamoyladenylate synthase
MMAETIVLGPGQPDAGVVGRVAARIKAGGVIVYPTETLYGIGADAGNADALRRLFAIKGREQGKPVLVIADVFETLHPFVKDLTAEARALMNAFWPGPLTLVFEASRLAPDELTAGTGTIGARIPSNEFCRALVRACGRPITSTSANRAGEPTPCNISEIRKLLSEGVDLFVDAGALSTTVPSTVVDVSVSPPRLLREGAVSWDQIEQILHKDS